MDEQRFESAPTELVRQYRHEIARIVEALGHPEALVTDESLVSDFPLREEDDGPTLTELRIELGLRVRRDDRLVDIARRLRRLTETQIAAATPATRHEWVGWLGERDAEALLLCLMHAIDDQTPMATLQEMVNGWRRNALKALAAENYRATVDGYLEVSVDARLYLLARPELARSLDDLEDEADEAL